MNKYTYRSILIILLSILLINACKKDNVFDNYNMRKSNLIGVWKSDVKYEYNKKGTNSEILRVNNEYNLNDTFNIDNTGKIQFTEEFPSKNATWYYQYSPEKVIVAYEADFFLTNVFEYTIIENKKDYQLWTTQYDAPVVINGEVIDAICKETRKMTRM